MDVSILKAKNTGFTLVELVVLISVIGILAVMVDFNWTTTNSIPLSAEVDKTINDIRYTQSLSMSRNQRYRFVVTSNNTYQITNEDGIPIPHPATGAMTITLGSGINFGTMVNLPNKMLVFDSRGIPYTDTAGTLLATTATIPLSKSGDTRTINITPVTGRIAT